MISGIADHSVDRPNHIADHSFNETHLSVIKRCGRHEGLQRYAERVRQDLYSAFSAVLNVSPLFQSYEQGNLNQMNVISKLKIDVPLLADACRFDEVDVSKQHIVK